MVDFNYEFRLNKLHKHIKKLDTLMITFLNCCKGIVPILWILKKSCTKDGITWSNSIELHCEKLRLMGTHSLNLLCSYDGFRDMHLLKFIIMVKNSTSLFLVSKWSCPCTCANPFHQDVPCLCMAPHLKFMVAILDVEHFPQQLGEVQVPLQKLFEPITLLPPYKTPWASKLETIVNL